ncbi:MAG: bis(5'-nucleosyl)-tetraphosphatase (symmetrical) YqeK [Lachnospiraceae bacterium]|nr:bis(5'-nucleosyl)-tetraphosphatase (symmetrical) YqeK [Lachnospiraceae bacterium]
MKNKDREQLEKYRKAIEKRLKPSRYEHSVGVAYTAGALAMRWETDMVKAMTAGFLHDWAKSLDEKEQEKLCRKYLPELPEEIYRSPSVLHAPLGAYLVQKDLEITDEEILSTIRFHTTGTPGMTVPEMILFTADYIEPCREGLEGLERLRRLAFVDLEAAVREILGLTLAYLERSGRPIDTETRRAYEYYSARA